MKTVNPFPPKMKKVIRQVVKDARWRMNLEDWAISISYMHKDLDEPGRNKVNAECIVDRRYLIATVKIYPYTIPIWKTEGNRYVEEMVTHELAHILTETMKDLAWSAFKNEGEVKDAWEVLTQQVARLALRIKTKPKKKGRARQQRRGAPVARRAR